MGGPFRKISISRTICVVQLVVVPLMKFLRELSSELPGDSVVEYRPPLTSPLLYIFYSFQSSDYPICTICYHPLTLYVRLLSTVRLPYLHINATTPLPYMFDCFQPFDYPICTYMLPPPYPICLIASNRPITLFAHIGYHPLTLYV